MTSQVAAPRKPVEDLGRLLHRVRTTCPTPERGLTGDFLEVWNAWIHRPYAASRWDLLRVLILNREVAGLASGPEGQPYAETARLNMVRLLARMGERALLKASEVQRMVTYDRDEDQWLRWLRVRSTGAKCLKALEAWQPSSESGRVLKEGCLALEHGAPELLELARGSQGRSLENTPLGTLRREIRLQLARDRVVDGDLEGALAFASSLRREMEAVARGGQGVDPEVRRLEVSCLLRLGRLATKEKTILASEARYAAYLSQRLAQRCAGSAREAGRASAPSSLDLDVHYPSSARRWRVEADAWKTLRWKLLGEVEP